MGQAGSKQEEFFDACSYGREWIVENLIQEGIDVNWKSHIHESCPIHVASQGKPKVVEMLIRANCDVDAKDQNGNTALHHAAMTGQFESAQLLIDAGASINAYNCSHWTPLINAAYWNHPQIIRLLLTKGANITWQNKEGRNALHELCRSKSTSNSNLHLSLELLLNESRRLETIQQLCYTHGKNLHTKWNVYNGAFKPNTFDLSSTEEQCPFIDLRSGSLNKICDSEAAFTPLLFATYHGHVGLVKTLIARNANVNAVDNNDWTALHWAAQRGHFDLAKLLIDRGASRLCQSSMGEMPFEVTSQEKIRELLEPDIPLCMVESNGNVTTDEEDGTSERSRSVTPNSRNGHRLLDESGTTTKEAHKSRRKGLTGRLFRSMRSMSSEKQQQPANYQMRLQL